MGAFGACYAIRANAFRLVPEHFLMEDFNITMNVHNQKLMCIMEPNALCYEDVPGNMWIEFKRKSRIAAGNFQNFFQFTNWLLQPTTTVGFTYFSHKVLRWLTPFLAIASIILVAILANYYWFYYYLFWYKFIFWIFFFADIVLVYFNIHIKPLRMLTYFYFMNVAIVVGFVKFLKGIKTSAWKPTDRNVKT
jgi:cellulose synthase/poly-beta-1,6-N-acetylglucosamine synthase-like glycosyltransferase